MINRQTLIKANMNSTTSEILSYFDLWRDFSMSTPGITVTSESNPAQNESSSFDISKSPLILGIAILYSILIVTSLTSNPLLIYVLLWRRKSQLKLIDIFVANLSLSDLFLTIFNIPLSLIIYFAEEWPFSSFLCQLGTYSTSCSIYVNIFTMAYISIDRYFAVTRPLISNPNYQMRKTSILLDDKTRKKIYCVLTLIWIIALILSVPQFLFSKLNLESSNQLEQINVTNIDLKVELDADALLLDDALSQDSLSEDPFKRCLLSYPYKNMKIYMIFVNFSLQYLIPSLVIIYFYGKIIYHLYLNLNLEELMEAPQFAKKTKKLKQPVCASDATNRISNNNLNADDSINAAISSATNLSLDKVSTTTRKKSRMRIEGLNRTRNLKKSIKVMIIIIALFLLSWLPIHLYRLVTTYIPFFDDLFEDKTFSQTTKLSIDLSSFGNRSIDLILQECKKNTSNKDCIHNMVNKAIKDIKVPEVQNVKINTLHNRYAFFICYFMSMSSVCYNPIVYFWMHKKFRAEVKQLFSRVFSVFFRLKKSQSRSDTSNLQVIATSNCTKRNNRYNNNQNANAILNPKSKNSSTQSEIKNIRDENDEDDQLAHLDSANSNTDKRFHNRETSMKNKRLQKLSGSIFALKTRNKRLYSFSAESTTSSSRKSTIDQP